MRMMKEPIKSDSSTPGPLDLESPGLGLGDLIADLEKDCEGITVDVLLGMLGDIEIPELAGGRETPC